MKKPSAGESPDSKREKAAAVVSLGDQGGGSAQAGSPRTLLLFELFVALALSISFFTLVRSYAQGPEPCNPLSFTLGSSMSSYQMEQPGLESWNGRLAGLLLGGWLVDAFVINNDQFSNVFGFYHAFWLFLLFLAIINSLRNSLFLNLGIGAALIYSFGPAAGMRAYPYDTAAALFFTLAILLHARRRYFLMLAVICAGCFFKETVLVCAVLVFFGGQWTWRRRLIGFFAVVMFYVLARKCLMNGMYAKPSAVGIAYAHGLGDLIPYAWELVKRNGAKVLSWRINSVAFVNVGTLIAVLVLGWRQRRYVPYRLLIVLFVTGQFVFGLIDEFRIFMEVLPLSWMLLSEHWGGFERPGVAVAGKPGPGTTSEQSCGGYNEGFGTAQTPENASPVEERIWPFRGNGAGLSVMSMALVVCCTVLVAWRYGVVVYNRNPGHSARVVEALRIKAEKGSADAQLALGMRRFEGNGVGTNWDEALRWFEKAAEQDITRNPNRFAAFRSIGGVMFKQGRLNEAIASFQKAAELQPNDFITHNNLGTVLSQKGRLDEAVAHFESALELKPDNADAHNNLGSVLIQERQLDKAITHFRKAADLQPNDAETQNKLGVALASKGQLDEAIAHCQKAVELQPGNANAHNDLAAALAWKGRLDEAIAHCRKAVELEPNNFQAQKNLGNMLLEKGRVDEAISRLQEALRLKPDDKDAKNNLIRALETKTGAAQQPAPSAKP